MWWLLAVTPSDELAEMLAYMELREYQPGWQQAGRVCEVVANAAGGKKGGGWFKASDFIPITGGAELAREDQVEAALRNFRSK